MRWGPWGIDDTGFAKEGDLSRDVARQHSDTLGNVSNYQIAVTVNAASASLDRRLFLTVSWDDRSSTDPAPAAAITARRNPQEVVRDLRRRASPSQVGDGDRDDRRAD